MKKNVIALCFCLFCLIHSVFSQVLWNDNCQLARLDGYFDFNTNEFEQISLRLNKWMETHLTSTRELSSIDEIVKKQYTGTGTISLTEEINKSTKLEFVFIAYLQKNRLVYTARQFLLIEQSTESPEKNSTYTDLNKLYEKQFKKKRAKTDIQLLIDEKLTLLTESLSTAVR